MRSVFAIAILSALAFGQSALASAQDDARFIIDSVVNEKSLKNSRAFLAGAYVDLYTDFLRPKHIRVLDHDKFVETLPTALTDQWLNQSKKRFVEKCLDPLSPEKISLYANALRKHSDLLRLPAPKQTPTVEEYTEQIAAMKKNPLFRPVFNLGMCHVGTLIKLNKEFIETVKELTNRDLRLLADILEEKGIFSFPNRIVKKSVIAELRSIPE